MADLPPLSPDEPARLDAALGLVPTVGWPNRVVNLLLLAALSLGAGLAISPGLYGQQIPTLRPEDVGKPFSWSSPAGFKASRDYEIRNDEVTQQRRQEAKDAVRAVFDLNPAVEQDLARTVHEAFASLRDALPPATPGSEVRRHHAGLASLPALSAARRLAEQKLAPLDDEDFQVLAGQGFSPSLESAVLALVRRTYATPLVVTRDDLPPAGSTITVRDVLDPREQVVSASSIADLQEARGQLEQEALGAPALASAPPNLRRALIHLVKRSLRANLTINAAETEARRAQAARDVKDAVLQIKRGQKIIGDGELITPEHLTILKGMREQTDQVDLLELQLGGMALVALLVAGAYAFFRSAFRRFRPTRKDGLLIALLITGLLAASHLGLAVADALHDHYPRIPVDALNDAIPVAAGAMMIRFLLTEECALFFSVVASALLGVLVGNSLAFAIYALVGSLVGAQAIARVKDRAGILRAGFVTGLANAAVLLVLALADGKLLSRELLVTALFGWLGGAFFAPTLLMAVAPLIELMFGYASDIKLLELANLNHPALKELIVRAPGTYHHSILVGSLVEGAAEAIGANALLARTCAYYHDIGKGRNPLYFGENQKGDNRHDCLAPSMSAVIIRRHVTDGLELARQYKLPKPVVDVVAQHHGTRLVGYFFHKACKDVETRGGEPVEEAVFRYLGPKPQFREAALVMIADAVEAASRAMPDASSAKLQALVQKIINVIFSEGQLDECDLTMRDLTLVARSFLHTLEGIYHTRPVYPAGAVGGPRPLGAAEAPNVTALPAAREGSPEAGKRSAGQP